MNFTLEQQYMLSILQTQCHAYWCTGNFPSQGISRGGSSTQNRNIQSLASEELTSHNTTSKGKQAISSFIILLL